LDLKARSFFSLTGGRRDPPCPPLLRGGATRGASPAESLGAASIPHSELRIPHSVLSTPPLSIPALSESARGKPRG